MKYWIISQHFYPEEVSTGHVMTSITETLSEHKKVYVITGSNADKSILTKRRFNEKRIFRPPFRIKQQKNILKKTLSQLVLSFFIFIQILRRIGRNDQVIIVTNPPFIIPIVAFLKQLIGFKLIIIVHDIFPENTIPVRLLNEQSFSYKLVKSLYDKSYSTADKIIAVGRDMKEILLNKIGNKKIVVITNWADDTEIYPKELDFRPKYFDGINQQIINIQFAGNLGIVQGLLDFFKIISVLNNKSLVFTIIGDGLQKIELQNYCSNNKLNNVHFVNSQPRNEQINFLNATDIGLITLTKGMYGLGVPSKVYNLMAAGKPIIFVGDKDSEIYSYIKQGDIGWAFDWSEKLELLNFLECLGRIDKSILREKGSRALKMAKFNFSKRIILKKYCEELIS